tara:strand:- start:61307 stop:62050 length:744 start_codon:yes stop_codon:yes gene_type:complete
MICSCLFFIKKIKFTVCCIFFISFAFGQDVKEKQAITGFIDFNAYYDTREFSVLTYNILANLPNRFQYFSLTNYKSSKRSFDLESSYAEHNLRWSFKENKPLDLTFQYVIRNGPDNDDFRFGLRWRMQNATKLKSFFLKLNMSYSINPMIIQFRSRSATKLLTQIEHAYRINLLPRTLNNRLYLGGFADQNINYLNNGGISFKWVSEHQLGYRLIDQLYIVLEYRINDFLPTDHYGLGYGFEYTIKF